MAMRKLLMTSVGAIYAGVMDRSQIAEVEYLELGKSMQGYFSSISPVSIIQREIQNIVGY